MNFQQGLAIAPPEEIGHFALVCSALTKHQFHAYQDDQKGFFLRRFKVRPSMYYISVTSVFKFEDAEFIQYRFLPTISGELSCMKNVETQRTMVLT